jgi:glycerophosphoryl diester phosphodiesterase
MNVRDTLSTLKQQRQILIAAHRGTCGGNIIYNTIPAYENALRHHADIVELDAAMSTDGVFYTFHDGTEPMILGSTRNIKTMKSSYVDELYMRNPSLELTGERVNKLEDVFNHLRGRGIINVDRTWFYWKEIIAFIKKTGMEDQVILKSPPDEEYLETLESMAPNLAYMPIIKTVEEAERVRKYKINYCMAELIFKDIDDPVVAGSFIAELHKQGLLLWVNVITLNERTVLSGGKDDRNAIMDGPDDNWGWCIDRGFDVLQTDWPMLLREYVQGHKVRQEK